MAKTAKSSERPPYYVFLSESELTDYLDAAGIREKDEVFLFYRICRYAEANHSGVIDIDEFTLELMRWAELNNFVRFRHLQNIRRMMAQMIPRLKEKLLAEGEIRDNEIVALHLYEPEMRRLSDIYTEITKNLAAPFPSAGDLPFTLPDSFFYELPVENFNQDGIAAAMEAGKPVKITFGGAEPEIYCPRQLLTDLSRIARLKIRMVLSPNNQKTKVLDDISRDLKAVLPDKVVSPERILQVLDGREQETPPYLINLAIRFITYMQMEREFKFKVTAVQAAKLLLNQKLYEENQKQAELEKNEKKFDMERALGVFRDVERLMSREEILSPESEKNIWGILTNKYSGASLRMLLSEMLDTYSHLQKTDNDDQNFDLLAPIVKLKSRHHDYFIHRDALVTYLLAERERIHNELAAFYVYNWSETIRHGGDDPAMKFDEFFIKDLEKRITNKYPEFYVLMSSSRVVMNAVYYSPLDTNERNRLLLEFFTRPAEPVFKPYHIILRLNRPELYKLARSKLPLSYRFFLFRWLLIFFRLFTGGGFTSNPAGTSEKNSGIVEDDGATSVPNDDLDKEQRKKEKAKKEELLKEIDILKMEYIGLAQPQDELKRLEAEWNIKIGPVREALTDKINAEIESRAQKILSIIYKQPTFSSAVLRKELENMADDMVRRAGDDVRSTKAFKKYLMIAAIEVLARS